MCDRHRCRVVGGVVLQQVGGESAVLPAGLHAGVPGGIARRFPAPYTAAAALAQGEANRGEEGLQEQLVAPEQHVVDHEGQEGAEDEPGALPGHVHHPGLIVVPLHAGLIPRWGRVVVVDDALVVCLGLPEDDFHYEEEAAPLAGHQRLVTSAAPSSKGLKECFPPKPA